MAICTTFCRIFCTPCAIACALVCGALGGQPPGLIEMELSDSMGVDEDGAGTVIMNGNTILITMSDSVGATG